MRLRFAALALLVVAGCSTKADDDEVGASNDEIRVGDLLPGEIYAVKMGHTNRFDRARPLASRGKIARVLENVGLTPYDHAPPRGEPGCETQFRIELFLANGQLAATAGFACDPARSSSPERGELRVGGVSYVLDARDFRELSHIGEAPLAIADVLYGADRIAMTRDGDEGPPRSSIDPLLVAGAVAAFDGDAAPSRGGERPGCEGALRGLAFHKGAATLASIYLCDAAGVRTVGGLFVSDDAFGNVVINAPAIVEIERMLFGN